MVTMLDLEQLTMINVKVPYVELTNESYDAGQQPYVGRMRRWRWTNGCRLHERHRWSVYHGRCIGGNDAEFECECECGPVYDRTNCGHIAVWRDSHLSDRRGSGAVHCKQRQFIRCQCERERYDRDNRRLVATVRFLSPYTS
jgi:hypothetical protein